ncbi:hypothetical protein ABZ907_28485 [Nonomuraea wenchangensis]
MGEGQPAPAAGDVRFAADGTLEVYDGEQWGPYLPPEDVPDLFPIFKEPPPAQPGGET